MWQSPNSKTRKARAEARERARQSLHVKRVTAEIRSLNSRQPESNPEIEGSARILLNDLTPKGLGIYCNKAFIAGTEVAISLTVPGTIHLHGQVTYCQEQEHKTHVISAIPFYFRIGIKFLFENAAEEAAVKKYCDEARRALRGAIAA